MCNNNLVVDVVFFVVGLFGLLDGGFVGGLEGGSPLLLLLLPSDLTHVMDLDDGVHEDAGEEDAQLDVELHASAQMGGVGVGDHEADALPQAVVGEGRFFVPSEEGPVQTCNNTLSATMENF
jgi:hypothetical protein